MAEEFQAAVCGGSWWMSPRTAFNRSSCSSVIMDIENFGPSWPRDLIDMKSKPTNESLDGRMAQPNGGTTTMLPESAFQMMADAFSSSSPTTTADWNQNFLFKVQEEEDSFLAGGDDGSTTVTEAEHQGFTMDQLRSLFDSDSPTPPPPVRPLVYDLQWLNHQEIQDSASTAKKSSSELQFKRPRLETPSPLPTFKVRKEKLGDRITALQQLVSPFGKTDTASVLHEAIEYIKLLHDQVNILSVPYTKNRPTKQLQQIHDKVKDVEGHRQDLRSLGLCLVPVSSTFPVATEMATGLWTSSFEGSFS